MVLDTDILEDFGELYQCFNRDSNGVIGKKDDNWFVLPGSRIASSDTASYAKQRRTERLRQDGFIKGNLVVKECPVKSKSVGVTIMGRHGVSTADAERKTRSISSDEALSILTDNVNGENITSFEEPTGEIAQTKVSLDVEEGLTIDMLESVISDEHFQKLLYWQNKVNVFSIVGQTHTEHWHSSFLSWLFDPNSSLGLKTFPLERLLYIYLGKKENSCINFDDVDNFHLEDVQFQTEKSLNHVNLYGWKQGSVDVYGESDELVIVIENKVTVKEETKENNVGQTQMYYEYVEGRKEKNQKVIYFFITPDPSQKPYCKEFVHITYQEIFDLIIAKCICHPEVEAEGKYVLEQYASNLREPYKKEKKKYPMALVHMSYCEEFYQKYSEQLDNIFQMVKYKKVHTFAYRVYRKYKDVFDEIYMSVEKYGKTPDADMERKVVTFTDLYNAGKLQENTEFYMNYNGVRHYAKIVKNSDVNEYYLALLDDKKELYKDESGKVNPRYSTYKTSSSAAGDAVYLYRKNNGNESEKPSLNGKDYWMTVEGDIRLSELIETI